MPLLKTHIRCFITMIQKLFQKSGSVEWLLVFLGNPGPRYAGTRHNAGFITADAVEKLTGVKINKVKYKALTAVCELGGARVMLMKPQTYMNLSGEAVIQAVNFYKIPPERVIVVSDEMSLETGRVRIRTKGSAGGHNGLKSIISVLGTDEFPRIRLGVGAPPHEGYDVKDWVLSVFKDQDAENITDAAERAAKALECYISEGPDRAMNKYNR